MRPLHSLLAGMALIATTAAVTAQVASNQKDDGQAPAWLTHCERGEHHERLDRLVGNWNQTVRFWESADAEPETSEARATFKWILGGRILEAEVGGYVLGDRLEVRRLLGYDSFREEYFTFMIDNRSTSYMLARGAFDPKTRSLVLEGTNDDVSQGRRDRKFRIVQRGVNDNEYVSELFVPDATGRMFRTLEIRAVRAE